MSSNLEKLLTTLSDRIKEAGNGNSIAQKKVSEIFAAGQIIPKDAKMAAFWSNISEESKYYRTTRHPIKKEESRPFNFIVVNDEYAREVKITPLCAIEEATSKALELVEEHKKRTSYTYIVQIKKYDNSKELLALMGVRAVFGWTSSVARSNLASLPYSVTDFNSREEALSALEELKKSGVTAVLKITNGLGEDVTNGTWKP